MMHGMTSLFALTLVALVVVGMGILVSTAIRNTRRNFRDGHVKRCLECRSVLVIGSTADSGFCSDYCADEYLSSQAF